MPSFFRFTVFVLVVCVAVIIGVVVIPFSRLNKNVVEGDGLLNTDKSFLALRSYKLAEKDWVFLKWNIDFQQKIKIAQQEQAKYKSSKPALIVYLRDKLPNSNTAALVQEINSMKGVINTKYISSEEALKIYREHNKNNPLLLELITPNILPASIEVYMSDWNLTQDVADALKGSDLVDEMIFSTDPLSYH